MKIKGFSCTCNACGSDNVHVEFSPGQVWSEHTADSGSCEIVCRVCGSEFDPEYDIYTKREKWPSARNGEV